MQEARRRRQPVLLTLALVTFAAFCFAATLNAILSATGATSKGMFDAGGSALIWFFLAVGTLALVPFSMERAAFRIFKPGALQEIMRRTGRRIGRLASRRP